MFVNVDNLNLERFAYEIVQGFYETNIALGKGNKTA